MSTDVVLTDSGLETELLFLDGTDLPDFAAFPLLRDPAGRERLVRYFRRHVEVADRAGLGTVLETATWRASADWGARLGHDAAALAAACTDSVAVVREAVAAVGPRVPVTVSGCLGPRGDGYDASAQMTVAEAEAYHRPQVEALAAAGVDQVSALTMTHVQEAAGIVRAAVAAGVPVVVSFTVETDGRLPSGDTLAEAVAAVDDLTGSRARHLGVNCAHPDHVAAALDALGDLAPRVRMFRANASRSSHAELDVATTLDDGDPVELGTQMAGLHRRHPHLRVLGGCCGTDARHVEEIARALTR